MTIARWLRSAAVLALAMAGCSTSSSATAVHDGGTVAGDAGLDADASGDATQPDSSEPVDATEESEEPDSASPPPVDAAPVDAAYACANPTSVADCAYCKTRGACVTCATMGAGTGAAASAFKGVFECLNCFACYTSCSGAQAGCSPPTGKDPCDSNGTTALDCENCSACAVMGENSEAGAGSCSGEQSECIAMPGCAGLLAGTEQACKNLP